MYTLGQAAKATGKSKPTIQAAIKKGRISAKKGDDGSYEIDPSELHRVYPPISQEEPKTEQSLTALTAEKLAEIKGLERTLKSMEELLVQVKGERDRAWQEADHWRHRCLALEAPKQSFPAQPEGEGAGAAAASPKAESSADTATVPQREATPTIQGWWARVFGRSAA